jgi:hypothetical protein
MGKKRDTAEQIALALRSPTGCLSATFSRGPRATGLSRNNAY